MKIKFALLSAALLILSTALVAQEVSYNADLGADFTKFKTYKWVQIKGGTQPDQLTDQQIKAALDAELSKKGLSKTESDSADLYIGYQVAIDQEKQINSYDMGGGGWGYGPRWGYRGGMGGMSTATTSTIKVGTLVLDMYNPSAKQLVWRGTATKTLSEKTNPEKRQKGLAKAAQKLLKNYPPKQK